MSLTSKGDIEEGEGGKGKVERSCGISGLGVVLTCRTGQGEETDGRIGPAEVKDQNGRKARIVRI